jgi:chromosome partitioning protein
MTANLGAGLAKKGRRVLLVDMDNQGSLSDAHGLLIPEIEGKTIYEVLMGDKTIPEVMREVAENVFLVPANIALAAAELDLPKLPAKDTRLKKQLAPVLEYFDYVLMDSPPSLGVLTTNCLAAATEVIVPFQAEYFAAKAVLELRKTLEMLHRWETSTAEITGIVVSQYNPRRRLNQAMAENIRELFPNQVFKTIIPQNTHLAEAPAVNKSIFDHKADSPGAKAFQDLVMEVMSMEEVA